MDSGPALVFLTLLWCLPLITLGWTRVITVAVPGAPPTLSSDCETGDTSLLLLVKSSILQGCGHRDSSLRP